MGIFANNAITDAGKMLLADVQAGAVFTPTRIVMGSGSLPSGTAAHSVTDVIAPVKSLAINKKKRTPDGQCVFGGVYNNAEVTEPFYFRELALYAKAVYLNDDGTVKSDGAETLYSYGNAGATADYMPAYSTSTVVEKQIDLVTWVGNDAQVDMTIESGIYATREQAVLKDVITATLTKAGWYKIGTLFNESFSGACATFNIRGQYFHYWPASAIVDVVCAFNSAVAKTRLQAGNFTYQISKLGLVKEDTGTYSVYVYYAYDSTNVVEITAVTQPNTFVSTKFEAADILESGMVAVAHLDEYADPALVYGVEYRTTERRNGKAVYKKLDTDGVFKHRLEGETAWRTSNADGYVSKVYQAYTDADINAAMLDAYHLTADNTIGYFVIYSNVPDLMLLGGAWHMAVYRRDTNYGMFELTSYDSNTTRKMTRSLYEGFLQPVAWDNPPMAVGVEYRTTERFHNEAVYKKIDANGNILWRKENESLWRLLSSASYVSPATVE